MTTLSPSPRLRLPRRGHPEVARLARHAVRAQEDLKMPGSPRVQPGDKYNLSYAAVVTKSFDDIAALTQSPPCTTLTVMSAELPGSAAGLPGFPPPSPPPSPPPEYDDYDGDGYDDVVGALDDDGSDGHITDKQVSDDGDLGRVAPEYDDYDGDGYDDDVGALDDQPADDDHANEQHDEPYDTEDEERSGVKWSDVWPECGCRAQLLQKQNPRQRRASPD